MAIVCLGLIPGPLCGSFHPLSNFMGHLCLERLRSQLLIKSRFQFQVFSISTILPTNTFESPFLKTSSGTNVQSSGNHHHVGSYIYKELEHCCTAHPQQCPSNRPNDLTYYINFNHWFYKYYLRVSGVSLQDVSND